MRHCHCHTQRSQLAHTLHPGPPQAPPAVAATLPPPEAVASRTQWQQSGPGQKPGSSAFFVVYVGPDSYRRFLLKAHDDGRLSGCGRMGGGVWQSLFLLQCCCMSVAAALPGALLLRLVGATSSSSAAATTVAAAAARRKPDVIKPMRGWFGVYSGDDFYPSAFNQSANETVWDTFHFGRATLDNKASGSTGPVNGWEEPHSWHPAGAADGRMTLRQNLQYHCAHSNSIYGKTSCGAVNTPNDTDIWQPLPGGGMIQAARRWSLLSQQGCPQVAGMM
eukprot:COSAG01_NODE_866_length_13045_cov_12.921288_3_plen_277_part_00